MMSVDQMPQQWMNWQGQIINNRFELGQYLGGSDDSAVYLTTLDPAHQQKAAIKLVVKTGRPEAQLSQWETLKGLSHTHLIRLYEAGECNVGEQRLLYVVMECADENLSTLLPSRALTPDEARDMLDATLDALSYVHGQGLAHGHIKPSNIMAVGETLKLASDGITLTGKLNSDPAKTDAYLAPEAASGGPSQAGDVWALGVTLVEALTQKAPAGHNDSEIRNATSALPTPFRKIAELCLRPDPKQRGTISDIQSELRSPPPQPVEAVSRVRTPDLPKRRGLFAPVATIVSLGVIAGLFFLSRHNSVLDSSEHAAQQEVASPPAPLAEARPAEMPGGVKTAPIEPANPPAGLNSETSGKVIRRVMPEVSKNALRTVHGTVRVKVRIHADAVGNVEKARIESGGPSRYFAGKSLEAARQWKFQAPGKNGKGGSSDWDVEFQFTSRSSKVREKPAHL